MFINHQPFLIIISSPSGAGKSTLCKMIIQNDPLIRLSTSATTRTKREQEVEGKDYHFLDQEKFDQMVENNEFIEHAQVFNNSYGTPRKTVDEEFDKGNCVLFDIDWQGARQIRKSFSKDSVVSIFILPPSMDELERRLRARAQDSEDIVQSRMSEARDEISHYDEYDYVVLNDDLENSYKKIKSIIEAKRLARNKKEDLAKFVSQFS